MLFDGMNQYFLGLCFLIIYMILIYFLPVW